MDNNAVITTIARQKLVKARAGAIILPKIVGMAFGDGGTDSAGNVINPNDNQTELVSELYRKEIDSYTILDETATVRYECTLEANEMSGNDISEIGLYDSEGDLVCIKTFRKKGKDDNLEMTFTLDDVF